MSFVSKASGTTAQQPSQENQLSRTAASDLGDDVQEVRAGFCTIQVSLIVTQVGLVPTVAAAPRLAPTA